MKRYQIPKSVVTLLSILFMLGLLLTGCKELSNDPPDKNGTLVVNVKDIQKQVGYAAIDSTDSRLNSVSTPSSTEATDAVKSLLVGAFVVTSRDTPYTRDVALTSDIEDNLKDELAGSIDYIKIVNLPINGDYIEFPYPKSELSKWQVIAVGLDFDIKEFVELGEDKHSESIRYAGFSPNFYKASDIKDNTVVTVSMFRACLTNPVKGCATYNDSLDSDPVVTPAVEILGVRVNSETSDFASSVDFPLIVRTDDDANNAIDDLKTVVTEIEAESISINQLTVRSTHTMNTVSESADCTDLSDVDGVTVSQLESACSVNLNKITLVK